jgi:signal peptidase I
MAKKENQKEKKPRTTGAMIWEIVQTLVMAVALYFAIDFCVARVRVENVSMESSFTEGELLMVNRLNYKFSEPERGDVVIFKAPTDPKKDYIKRMIGLPGDKVSVQEGKLFINDSEIQEPWVHEPMAYSGEWVVPENEYFVLGDNRNHSSDSHSWGFVPRKNLVGNAFFCYWPLNHIRVVNNHIDLPMTTASNLTEGN